MKTIATTIVLIICCTMQLAAQEGKISLTAHAGSSGSTGISNALSFNPAVGLEVFWGGFGIGADAGMFATRTDLDFNDYVAPLKGRDIFTIGKTRSKWTSTYILAGPQYTFGTRAWALTLSLKGGVTHQATPELMVTDNMSRTTVAAYTAPADAHKNVFTIKPGLNLAYKITSRLSVNANVQYLLQPSQRDAVITYKDLGSIDYSGNAQEISTQISKQDYMTSNTKGPDKYMSAGMGIGYSFGAKKRHYRGKVTKPGTLQVAETGSVAAVADDQRTYTGGRKNEGQPAGKSISSKGVSSSHKNEAAVADDQRTYTGGRKNEGQPAGKSISSKGVSSSHKNEAAVADDQRTYTGGRKNEDQPAAKSISEKGVSRSHRKDAAFLNSLFIDNGKELDPRLFKQVTADSDIKGMKVAIKRDHKVYKYLGDQNRIVEILKSANRPTACTDCTTRECNGKVYECACVNGFCFCVLCIEISTMSELAE